MCHQCCISSGFFYYLNCYTTSSKRFSRSLLSQSEIIALLRSNLCAMAKQIYQPCDAYLTDVIAPCKGIQDSLGFCLFHTGNSGFLVLDSTDFVGGTWILESKGQWDSGFLELHFGFHSPRFSIPEAKISRIPEYGVPLHRANIRYRPIRPRV